MARHTVRTPGPPGRRLVQRLEQVRPLSVQGVQFLEEALQKVGRAQAVRIGITEARSGRGLHFPAQREDAAGLVRAFRDRGRSRAQCVGVCGRFLDDFGDPVAHDHPDVAQSHQPVGYRADCRRRGPGAFRRRGRKVEVDDEAPAIGHPARAEHRPPLAVLEDLDRSGVRDGARNAVVTPLVFEVELQRRLGGNLKDDLALPAEHLTGRRVEPGRHRERGQEKQTTPPATSPARAQAGPAIAVPDGPFFIRTGCLNRRPRNGIAQHGVQADRATG